MRIIEYSPERFDALQAAACRTESRNLRCREFVDYYYTSSPWCRLYLLMSRDDSVIGVLGLERMPFRYGSREFVVGFGTNYYSLENGVGGFLFRHWLKHCDVGISFGGSKDAHALIRAQGWTYFDGVEVYLLNRPFKIYESDPAWKRAAKHVARFGSRRPIVSYAANIPANVKQCISVLEVTQYTPDIMPLRSPFEFRFAPSVEYLAWRYNTQLPFVRYRAFRVLDNGSPAGYVILNERDDRILVAQCDGDNPETLAWGVVCSVLTASRNDVAPRTVMLTCTHPAMRDVYQRFGFKRESDHPFALGSTKRDLVPSVGADTSKWLVNFDWGDNGLLDPIPVRAKPRLASSGSRI